MWTIIASEPFKRWWGDLDMELQAALAHDIEVLRRLGPVLGRPHADTVHGSRHANLKELRTRHRGQAWRVLYAFDPRRQGVLLIGGAKTGNRRSFTSLVTEAERILDEHLAGLHADGGESEGTDP